MKPERRYVDVELRAEGEDGAQRIVGHAAVFNQVANIGGMFREQIAPGAFREAIGRDDVRALFNHDKNFVLGRTASGTLTLSEDERGLAVVINPPDTQWARDLMVSIGRGDISQMSFAFSVPDGGDTWDRSENLRTVNSVKLYDVSPVTYPAYNGTDAGVRSAEEIFESFRDQQSGGGAEVLALRLRELDLIANL